MKRWLVTSSAVLLWYCAPPLARAQEADATSAAAARALFAEGVSASDAGDWAAAADHFRRASALRSSPTISLNLAVALGHLGRLVEAAELLRGVQRHAEASETVRGAASAALAELEPRIAWTRLEVLGGLEGVSLAADGRPLSPSLAGSEVPFDPGPHRLTATRDGVEVGAVEFACGEGQRSEVSLVVAPPAPASPDEPPPVLGPGPGATSPTPSVDPLALGLGLGGGAVVLGGVLTLVLVLALPGEPAPFVGNAGVLEIGR